MSFPQILRFRRAFTGLLLAALLASGATAAAAAPSGRAVMAWHVTVSPSWFDPSTAPPQITPFGMLYAIHDALVRPYPGHKMGPSLAESWKESPDGKTYEFKLRPGLKFHNGDPLTTEDVKFSFERYKGASAKILQEHVAQVEIVDPLVVRFHLKAPWPDFMTVYGTTASAAGLIVPKNYMTQVGDDGFKKHPIGAGPYKFVSHKAGCGGRARGLPRLLAPRAEREDAGHEERARVDDARRDAENRRGRHRLRRSTAPTPKRSRKTRACKWSPRSTRRSSGSSSPSSGTPSRPGTTSGCGWR